MSHLQISTKYELIIASPISHHKKIIIMQYLNTHTLNVHLKDIIIYSNLLAFHMFFV
jgi:hypothetical protein